MDIKSLKRSYNDQKFRSKSRVDKKGMPINWQLTFDDWLKIWIESGKLYLRGKGKGKYCMSRKNDIGPYAIDNVEIVLNEINISKGQVGRVFSSRIGKNNPNARSINLRGKCFNTIQEAATSIGYTVEGLRYRIKKGYEWTS